MPVVRVLVVEDSQTVRGYIRDVLARASDLEVVGEAADGKTAVELCAKLRPNVVTMDMMLHGMSGLDATEAIMATCPTPILIVSASTNRGELFRTYDALAAGAVDVLEKPLGTESDGEWERQFVAAVKLVARIPVITHLRARTPRPGSVPRTQQEPRIVGMGASTGGPAAVREVLLALPPKFAPPILLVIHIAEPFGAALAEWLDTSVPLSVRLARDGDPLPKKGQGIVLLAPAGRHLVVADDRLHLLDGPPRHSCRPSVDVLFESLAREAGDRAVACLLTGMGRDGAQGLLAVKEHGGLTLAQDEASSVIYGMPGEAVKLGAVNHTLPLCEIGPFLSRLCPAAARKGARDA